MTDVSLRRSRLFSLTFMLGALLGCRGAGWQVGSRLAPTASALALVLGDPQPGEDTAAYPVPEVVRPEHTRPCCAFGMDLRVRIGGIQPPMRQANVLGVVDARGHEYDNGALSVEPNARVVAIEGNGLVYTCRGGWIDLSHVRENADLQLFLTTRFMRQLGPAFTMDLPGDGAQRRISVAAIPREVLDEYGHVYVATRLAEWTTYRFSIWHEVASWYGWQSTPILSERVSAFSPEDLYSNILGIRLSAAIFRERGYLSRDEYNSSMDLWLPALLTRLQGLTRDEGRAVMHALDGRWWDSSKILPDNNLVTHRHFPGTDFDAVTPWRFTEAFGSQETVPAPLAARCPGSVPALTLHIPDRVGPLQISELVRLEWRPEQWADASFPFPHPDERLVRSSELPAVVQATRVRMRAAMSPGFDEPATAPRAASTP